MEEFLLPSFEYTVKMLYQTLAILTLAVPGYAAYLDPRQPAATATSTSEVPQYFQTTPEIYAGVCSDCPDIAYADANQARLRRGGSLFLPKAIQPPLAPRGRSHPTLPSRLLFPS